MAKFRTCHVGIVNVCSAHEHPTPDGVSGYCRVTYEVRLLNDLDTEDRAFNVTKTKHLDDCQQRQYADNVNNTQGYTADRPKHLSNNLLPMPLSNTSDTGHPDSLNTVDSEAHEVSRYLVNGSSIESALSDSLTILPLIVGPVLVRTHLQLRLVSSAAPPMGTVQFDGEPHTSLKLNLSEVAGYLNIPGYSDLLVKPAVFTQLLDEVAEELANYEFNVGREKGPVVMLRLMRMISLLNIEQLKETMPPSLLRETSELEPKEQLLRALYIELLGNARSKSAVKMTLHLMKEQLLSRQEAGRLFRDMFAFFVAYSDEETRELFQDMCRVAEGIVNPRIREVACSSSLVWRVPKVCPPGHISR
ncbi:hypothetical protein HPB50_005274 [Hyalomma asiaticum]|uniref:Uncharacterized protein n=1 Tax=Hyalomma asiaticum TaxID=266040 RepID=A0ACB7T1C2_HYAAI|nr:hypothetical protein HPB50_005274 [Hyalomma asiaticum]